MTVHPLYHAPESWDAAVSLLQEYGPDAKILAGGSDLMVLLERGKIAPRHLVSLDRIPHWNELAINGALTLGAGTTYRQLEKTPQLYDKHLALVAAARQVGGVQVRNIATVAGNFCNASPAADAVPPLLVMDAFLTIYGPQGERTVAADEFITGPGKMVLRAGEVLRQINVPALPDGTATVFLKAGRRQAMEISFVGVAVRLTLIDGICQTARIALGAAAPTPIRAREAERILEGQRLTPESLAEAADLAAQATEPISDVRASAHYRQHLSRVMVRRALEQCHQKITGESIS